MYTQLSKLTERYMEPWRKYHNLRHIYEMFQWAQEWGVELSEAQILAIWYHDAIMVLGADDNESESADLLRLECTPEMWPVNRTDIVSLAETIVLDTKNHKPSRPESAIVLDLDMAILGDEGPRYHSYVRGIREEFKAISYDVFNVGRLKFVRDCQDLARRDELFHTEEGKSLNGQAMRNLGREIKELTSLPERKESE